MIVWFLMNLSKKFAPWVAPSATSHRTSFHWRSQVENCCLHFKYLDSRPHLRTIATAGDLSTHARNWFGIVAQPLGFTKMAEFNLLMLCVPRLEVSLKGNFPCQQQLANVRALHPSTKCSVFQCCLCWRDFPLFQSQWHGNRKCREIFMHMALKVWKVF